MAFFQSYVFSDIYGICHIWPKFYVFKFRIHMYLETNEFEFPK